MVLRTGGKTNRLLNFLIHGAAQLGVPAVLGHGEPPVIPEKSNMAAGCAEPRVRGRISGEGKLDYLVKVQIPAPAAASAA